METASSTFLRHYFLVLIVLWPYIILRWRDTNVAEVRHCTNSRAKRGEINSSQLMLQLIVWVLVWLLWRLMISKSIHSSWQQTFVEIVYFTHILIRKVLRSFVSSKLTAKVAAHIQEMRVLVKYSWRFIRYAVVHVLICKNLSRGSSIELNFIFVLREVCLVTLRMAWCAM